MLSIERETGLELILLSSFPDDILNYFSYIFIHLFIIRVTGDFFGGKENEAEK